jgi:hypothetical protein
MAADQRRLESLIRQFRAVSEAHHAAFKKTGGKDPDWVSWYVDWLLEHTRICEVLEGKPCGPELAEMLESLDQRYQRERPSEPWEEFYAEDLLRQFGAREHPEQPSPY